MQSHPDDRPDSETLSDAEHNLASENSSAAQESLPAEGHVQQRHADKYNDPRVQITRRGILFGVVVLVFGIVGSFISIWARRTQLEKTTEFWGEDVVTAFQLAEEVELQPMFNQPEANGTPVRLSGMPGLGHLRHVLLDDRSYAWGSVTQKELASDASDNPSSDDSASDQLIVLHWSDPTAGRFEDLSVAIELEQGWVGKLGGGKKVQLNERYREAVPKYLKRIADFEPIRVENRKDPNPEPES
ncbi:hypothetical protein [Roseiconus lacunae]|uniref:hypothetical protein n=1 Tax=Roseiconus lacunae TaxID=2605694 RepID=UPI001E49FB75|nr:hypothetical protein [Roseiconus lacunae]MCD0463170.1 hypothetical protein [Roseiconus lacunae]